MRTAFVAAMAAALAGCAASGHVPDASAPSASEHAADFADAPAVAVESFQDEPVCTRVAPTGSRIAVERCESRDPAEQAMQAAIRNQSRDDLEEMRRRQLYQEQARQQALQQAIMRSRGPR